MPSYLNNRSRFVGLAMLAVLAGCAQQSQTPAQPVAVYNPPGEALAALPATDVTWYHVPFATNSSRIEGAGRQAINNAVDSMRGRPAMTATVVGKTDTVGSDANNMRLAQQRATAVRNAMMGSGQVTAGQIETRWTGERQAGGPPMSNVADAGGRMVDIGVH